MNKKFIIECIDIIERIKLNSIIAITKDNEELKYKLIYDESGEYYELLCLDEKDAIWDDGNTIKEIKEGLVYNAVKSIYQKIRLL